MSFRRNSPPHKARASRIISTPPVRKIRPVLRGDRLKASLKSHNSPNLSALAWRIAREFPQRTLHAAVKAFAKQDIREQKTDIYATGRWKRRGNDSCLPGRRPASATNSPCVRDVDLRVAEADIRARCRGALIGRKICAGYQAPRPTSCWRSPRTSYLAGLRQCATKRASDPLAAWRQAGAWPLDPIR